MLCSVVDITLTSSDIALDVCMSYIVCSVQFVLLTASHHVECCRTTSHADNGQPTPRLYNSVVTYSVYYRGSSQHSIAACRAGCTAEGFGAEEIGTAY